MTQNKTIETTASVADFLATVTDATKHADCLKLVQIMEAKTGFKAKMWGTAIVGFGSYHYKYESGREGDAPLAAFSPRKAEISLYLSPNPNLKQELLPTLGKHKTGTSCIYIKKLQDINEDILSRLIVSSVTYLQAKYPG